MDTDVFLIVFLEDALPIQNLANLIDEHRYCAQLEIAKELRRQECLRYRQNCGFATDGHRFFNGKTNLGSWPI